MAQYTTRDTIWNVALTKDTVTPSQLGERLDISERTVRDCLETMHDFGWLEKEGGAGSEPVEYTTVIDPEPKEMFALD